MRIRGRRGGRMRGQKTPRKDGKQGVDEARLE